MVNQVLDNETDSSPTFAGRVTSTHTSNRVCQMSPAKVTVALTSGWHTQLKVYDQELTWWVDTGAQVSVVPEICVQGVIWNTVITGWRTCGRRWCSPGDHWICNHEPCLRRQSHCRTSVHSQRGIQATSGITCYLWPCSYPSNPRYLQYQSSPSYTPCR